MPRKPRLNASKSKGQKREESIIDALRRKPSTMAELAVVIDTSESNVWVYLNRMRKGQPKRVHISGHVSNTGRFAGRPAPIFALGNRPDVEFVPLNKPTPKTSAAERREQILGLLRTKPQTSLQLAGVMHVCRDNVLFYLTQLKREQKVYISRWMHPSRAHPEGNGGSWSPVYAAGSKADKPRPKPETSSERHARKSLDPAYRAERNRKRAQRYQVEKLLKKPQGIFAALGL